MNNNDLKIDPRIFIPCITVIFATISYMIVFEQSARELIGVLFTYITNQLGFVYLWAGAAAFGFVLWLCFGRYSTVRFGGADARPEFSRISWIGMFFCSGVGTSIMYWGSIEWSYYFVSPPFGLESKSDIAADYAAMYGIYHSGPIAWALLTITAFPIGYCLYNRKSGSLRLSSACEGLIGKKAAEGVAGKVIDILMVIGLVAGTGTSLASGTPMLAEAISTLLDVENDFSVNVSVVIIWTVIFMTSVYLGLEKGIKKLSDVNIVLLALLGLIVFFGGATYFVINTFTNSLGLMFKEFVRMTFYTDSVSNSQFPQAWTVFYWAWWVAYAPFVGMFIARISKGRTFRDVASTVVISGSSGCALFYAILGNNLLFSELNDLYPVLESISDNPSSAILGVLTQLPLSFIILPLFIVVGFIYSGTTVDSSAYILASITSKKDKDIQNPSRKNRVFWAALLGCSALALMNFGGLEPLKTASLVVGVPLILIMTMSVFSLMKWLKEDYKYCGSTKTLADIDGLTKVAS
ncbi:BCCT family transporter (plasmid) [Vibrio cyclitrophicus]